METAPEMPRKKTRTVLFHGFLALIPIAITIYFIEFIFNMMASFLEPLIRPILSLPAVVDALGKWHKYSIPAVSIFSFLILIYLIGVFMDNVGGKRLLAAFERFISRIPVIGSVYGGTKQVVETVTMSSSQSFKEVAIVDFPRDGMKALGFVTGIIIRQDGSRIIKMFIPTTPNPTTGFFEFATEDKVKIVDMSVEEAIKCIVSGGVLSTAKIDRLMAESFADSAKTAGK